VKNAQLYKQTAGWGWGRWRGTDLKPYGEDNRFAAECTSCHMPVRGADDVYTLPITPAKASMQEVVNNQAAALPSALPYQPLEWNVITMYVDRNSHTLSALFGNDDAILAIRSRQAGLRHPPAYPQGAVLALVTWAERDDPHWFGARIPATPRSVEFVRVGPQSAASSYQRFEGTGSTAQPNTVDVAARRRSFVLSLAPAILP
jgi:Cytochrome P460